MEVPAEERLVYCRNVMASHISIASASDDTHFNSQLVSSCSHYTQHEMLPVAHVVDLPIPGRLWTLSPQ